MYRGSYLSVGSVSATAVIANSFNAVTGNVSTVNFKNVTINTLLPTGSSVTIGTANVQTATILGTTITLGGPSMPVSFTGTLSLASSTQVNTVDNNIMVNVGSNTIVGAGLTVLSGSTNQIATARINATLDWEFTSPGNTVTASILRTSAVQTASYNTTTTFTNVQNVTTTNAVTASTISVGGNLSLGTLVANSLTTNTLSFTQLNATTANVSGLTVATSTFPWPNTLTSLNAGTVSLTGGINASAFFAQTISAQAFNVTTSLSFGSIQGIALSTGTLTARTSVLAFGNMLTTVQGTASVSDLAYVRNASIWLYQPATSTTIAEAYLSIVGQIRTVNMSARGTTQLLLSNTTYMSAVNASSVAVGSQMATSNLATTTLSTGAYTAIGNVSVQTLSLTGSMNAVSLSATGISASTGASVLSFVYAPAVTVTSIANLQSLTATNVFTQSLYATAGLDLGALSIQNLQTLSVNSRTQVPAIQFTGASGSPFRVEYGVLSSSPAVSSGTLTFTSIFATTLPAVTLQVVTEAPGNADDVINVVSGTLSTGGLNWFCTRAISNVHWMAVGL